jgi:hypothetical protein
MKIASFISVAFLLLIAAEKGVNFVPAKPDPLAGDYKASDMVAQVVATGGDKYQAVLLKGFDSEEKPIAVLTGEPAALAGNGWAGTIQGSNLLVSKDGQKVELEHFDRASPTLNAKPPEGAVILFDGKNLDAWAKKAGKDWLKEDGPAPWKLVDDAMEVVPGSDCIITHQKFGDCHLHVEFRTLGSPTNSGVFLQDRYEVNIDETYALPESAPQGGLDNCTDNVRPKIRPALPPLAWQTYDIDFKAPKFDGSTKKTQAATMTVLLNGVKIYDNQALDVPHGAAARLGEAPTGPLMLQEHGMPLQFRNIWVVETK